MTSPFTPTPRSIPVTIVTDASVLPPREGTAIIRIDTPLHAHAPGSECIACDARGNVRVLLFELLERQRRGETPPFTAVLVDATAASDPQAIVDALIPGRLPALGLRDHTVARSFHLVGDST